MGGRARAEIALDLELDDLPPPARWRISSPMSMQWRR